MSEIKTAVSNKRIAKNTLFLYVRMLMIMGVSLITVKIVLKTLGVVDYGIYNVVGSIITMLSFLSNTMASVSQRFFSFELGVNNREQLKRTFSMTMAIYLLIGLLIVLLAETIGLWFLNNKMTIPPERLVAAQWVFQFSILDFLLTMFTVPYNAAIIAHEKMKVYAYVSILDVSLKLFTVYALSIFSYDKLMLYSVLTFTETVFITFVLRTYCMRKFEECRLSFFWDKDLFKKLIGFSGWNLFGALSSMAKNSGVNIILNLFFGPVVNAARGIAYQVQIVLTNFGNNFFTAVRPQIIKSYAANQRSEMTQLIYQSTRFSFYLLFFLSLPFLLETKFFLTFWLDKVPAYTVIFVQWSVIDCLVELLVNPIITLVQATGKVKWYQIVVGGTRLLILPVAYVFFKIGFGPETIFYIMVINTMVCNLFRMIMVRRLIKFDVGEYLSKVISIIFVVCFVSYIIPSMVQWYWTDTSFTQTIMFLVFTVICSLASILLLGLNKDERRFIIGKMAAKLKLKN